MNVDAGIFPLVNATLNFLATILLLLGYVLIKQGKERGHKWTMLSCFFVSIVFLICYLTYHYLFGSTRFPPYPPVVVRCLYYVILVTHVVLAMYVPVGAVITIYYGLKDNRIKHRKWAKITFPIWLYVSVTGVIVYLMLYQIYPPEAVSWIFSRPFTVGLL